MGYRSILYLGGKESLPNRMVRQASKLVQVAKTKAEWQKVAEHWDSAVTFMQAVPTSHPKHTIAQKKVLEYQANLDYAKRAGNLAVN